MPRKTKRQKILARLHRLEQKTEGVSSNQHSTVSEPNVQTENQQEISLKLEQTETPTQATTQNSRYDYSYVYKDLRKIFILTAFALAVEIVLSLTASTSYAKLALRALNLDF